jgi:colanic acid/amylovoran biosynthesis protein
VAVTLAERSESAAVSSPRRIQGLQPGKERRLGLFGCSPDTGNKGVAALGLGTLAGLVGVGHPLRMTVFGYKAGARRETVEIGDTSVEVDQVGCFASRRVYRLDNLQQLRLATSLGMSRVHPMLQRLRQLDAVLDMSGGDSFSDIYGSRRFEAVAAPKLLAMQLGIPLVLLPQTYGPFTDGGARERARRVLRGAAQVWARDQHSLEVVSALLGSHFDPTRHRQGVDVAFGLPARRPADDRLVESLGELRKGSEVLVGLNVSGLLYNEPGEDIRRYGFRTPYRELIHGLLGRLLTVSGLGVVLIPHVTPGRPCADCDETACNSVLASLNPHEKRRVQKVPASLGPMEMKWAIGTCDWFCGTRMHACIGAISQCVPTVAIAYSDKTRGVFDTAGVGDCVVDPRSDAATEIVDRTMMHLLEKRAVRARLESRMPGVRRQLSAQFQALLGAIA